MRVLYAGNGPLALKILSWLSDQPIQLAGLVIHPEDRGLNAEELVRQSCLPDDAVFQGDRMRDPETTSRIGALKPDLLLSIHFGYILPDIILDLPPQGCVNLHPGYLPYTRGTYPNVWSIVDDTPAGVTLHYMDRGIDTGDLIARREVEILPTDTGHSLYDRLQKAEFELFLDTWPQLLGGQPPRSPQNTEEGSQHRKRDVDRIDCIDLDDTYRAGDLIDILRARTFPPYKGAYFLHEGRRIYLRLELAEEDSDEPEENGQ
ncbi:TPA: formyl transferase [Candidatus Latescibacteria bacterium]|nr:formyl transferase [Candidatus Latescibacterota bacterium]